MSNKNLEQFKKLLQNLFHPTKSNPSVGNPLPLEILDRLHAWESEAEMPEKPDGIDFAGITRTLGIWVIEIALHNKLPQDIKALNFDLFETGEPGNAYAVNLTGAKVYESDDDDWACEEDFVPSQRYAPALNVPSSVEWNEFLDAMVIILRDIIAQTNGLPLWNVKHITTGFSDGDLAVVK